MPLDYDFRERMVMSDGVVAVADVRAILLAEIPGAVNVLRSATENDKQGIDWWVEMSTARHLAVDAKVREVDWRATHPEDDDLALETWSIIENSVIGWTRDPNKKCDYVLWLWKDTGRFCLVPFPMLCRVFACKWTVWRDRYKTRQQRTAWGESEYHSECVFVPRRELWAEIYRYFGGDQIAHRRAA